jgi:predicted amidophosphoribosyltransferase
MAALIPADPDGNGTIDLVTWAPTTAERAATRGFDQAELLARRVARRLGLPCHRLLRRRPGPAQTGQDAASRRFGPRFISSPRSWGHRILIVDDIVTTGATLAAAADALRLAGAIDVSAVAAARTPLKNSGPSTDA